MFRSFAQWVGLVVALNSTQVSAMNLANVVVTTECTNCDGGSFAIYNDAVHLVVRGEDGGGAPTIDVISLSTNVETNVATGTVGSTWYVSDTGGRFAAYGTVTDELFGVVEAYRVDLGDIMNPVIMPGVNGQSFKAARVDPSGRVIGVLDPAHAQTIPGGAVVFEIATGTVVVINWPSRFVDVIESPDVILATSWNPNPPIPYEDHLYVIENGVYSTLHPGIVTGAKRLGSNAIDPITILATVDGVTGYIGGVFGTFQPLETGGSPVEVTDNFLFWNGANDCAGYSQTLGTFDLGSIAGAGFVTASSCSAAIEHNGKLYLVLDDGGVVVSMDVVANAPGLGSVGGLALVLILALAGAVFVQRMEMFSSASSG